MNPQNWTPLSNPLQEDEVKLELTWKADKRTLAALERQAKLNGFDNPAEYMLDIISFRLATDEADTVVKTMAGSVSNARWTPGVSASPKSYPKARSTG
jgi:hypothetical protein